MSDVTALRDTIIPKSDQLNGDTLMAGPITVEITDVRRGAAEQPIDIHISGGHQCWRPCKSMRRILITAWGENGKTWIGKSVTLYFEPSIKFGGVAVGGIRIAALSHIESDIAISLTTTRGKRSPYTVKKLEILSDYPADRFEENLPAWLSAIKDGRATAKQILAKVSQSGRLTTEQINLIESTQEAAQ